MNDHEIKNILENKLNIDPELFLEILENVFKVNIILFCRNRISNKEGRRNIGLLHKLAKRNFIIIGVFRC